jgi:hypothetical protein
MPRPSPHYFQAGDEEELGRLGGEIMRKEEDINFDFSF